MRKEITEIIGWYGMVAIISAYFLVSFSVITTESIVYQLLNLTGAIGIIVISLIKRAYQPAVLNVVWAVIASMALIRLFI